MKYVCVYCGSSAGKRLEYKQLALGLANAMHERGLGLVYGGGAVGLMGAVAREALKLGCEVKGVITHDLFEREVGLKELPDLKIVDTMHERKALMAQLADGFIALPGGLGTLDEIFEAMTWTQLGIHQKPCGFLNVCDYYTPLMKFLSHSVSEGFICESSLSALFSDTDPGCLLDAMESFRACEVPDKAKLAIELEMGSAE